MSFQQYCHRPSPQLRIMQDSYTHLKENTKNQDDSLMSPPLTPTDAPLNDLWHCNANVELPMPSIESPRKNRKQFIKNYARMVPSLQKKKRNAHGIFALNVYRDILLKQEQLQQQKKQDKSKYNHCVRSDNAVPHTKKRKTVAEDGVKRKRVSSVLPSGKDAALAFDAVDIDTADIIFYPQGWAPFNEALDQVPVKVNWKGAPLPIDDQPYFDHLHHIEATMASVLRLSPVQYLRCKRTLILAARTLKIQQIPFTKSVAQKLCRVDVNKTSALWTAFGQLGWFDGPI
ncbi:hypothetical protein BD408DRAFT_423840 [Parasitella parasitica]|nr:hypothetical protein BD408DRAFT_423840 [Parasitella parasitica]